MSCVFCMINAGAIPSKTIFEDDKIKVIMDINPNTDGHLLMISKIHYGNLIDAPDELIAYMFKKFQELTPKVIKALDADGVTLYENHGLHQEINHVHLHILPVYKDMPGVKFLKQGDVNKLDEIYSKLSNV